MCALTVAEIAEICDGQIEGDRDRLITGANTIEEATGYDLSFAGNQKAIEAAQHSSAGCLLVSSQFAGEGTWSLIRVKNPRAAFARAIRALFPVKTSEASIHPTAVVHPSALVAVSCSIGAYVSIGENSSVGNACVVGDGCRLGSNVFVGEGSVLKANVTIYDDVRIGERALIHSGAVLGADGFGFAFVTDHYEKFPQIGGVEVGDDVEIGANCCIDRAALGVTRIGNGTKLDNMVHIAHNCDIGKHVVIAAQAGFSGSVTVGDYAVIGGQAGIGEKAVIEGKAILGGKCGVLTGQKISAGEPVWGIPARPLRQHLKGLANVAGLSEWKERMKLIEHRLAELQKIMNKPGE